jgi:hypothetical protein
MANHTWDYKILKLSDLPKKAQRFIEIMEIDTSDLMLMQLTPCPDGEFIKSFHYPPDRKCVAIAEYSSIYFFGDYKKARTAIHELAHIYFTQARFFKGIEYDFKAIAENFIAQRGRNTLTNYAQVSIYENAWEEVVCEVIATHGSKGQFNKIKELLNQ